MLACAAPIVVSPGDDDVADELDSRRRARPPAPTMQNGPIRTPSPMLGRRPRRSARRMDRWVCPLTRVTSMAPISASATSVPSTLASPRNHHMLRALVDLGHVVAHHVARHDGLAELALVDGHEEDRAWPRRRRAWCATADRARRLRHALDQQHAGKDRLAGEMPGELRLVERDVLDADAGVVAVDLDDAVDQQERVAVRQQLQDLLDVGRAELQRLRRRRSSRISLIDPCALAVRRAPNARRSTGTAERPALQIGRKPSRLDAARSAASADQRAVGARRGGLAGAETCSAASSFAEPVRGRACAGVAAPARAAAARRGRRRWRRRSARPCRCVRWPTTPTWPPSTTKSSSVVEPEMPTCETMTQWRPIDDVVADLDEIVDLGALADHRVAAGAAVDRRVGADLDVVLDDDPADLRHLEVAARAHGEAEAVLADAHAGMDDDAVADQRVAAASLPAPIAQSRPIRTCGPMTRVRTDDRAGADLGARADDRAGIDGDARLRAAPSDGRRRPARRPARRTASRAAARPG